MLRVELRLVAEVQRDPEGQFRYRLREQRKVPGSLSDAYGRVSLTKKAEIEVFVFKKKIASVIDKNT